MRRGTSSALVPSCLPPRSSCRRTPSWRMRQNGTEELHPRLRRLMGMNRAVPVGGILTIIAIACACGGSGDHPTTVIHSHVAPRQPLRPAACMNEMRGWGYSVGAARPSCAQSASQAEWFHATFTNASARGTYIQCRFTAWDAGGRQLFHGSLPLGVVRMPASVYLNPHQSRSMDWYFDARIYPAAMRHTGAVARYTSFCTPLDNPPI
jgi:hypothetical protein